MKNYAPDADSIRFQANDDSNWDLLVGSRARLNSRGHAQLRFEAIDALETHYRIPGGNVSQPRGLADGATDRMMALAGIRDVEWNSSRSRVRSALDGQPGHIIAAATERYRRPISFVFTGNGRGNDGSIVNVTSGLLRRSLNYRLLNEGWVYPTFYRDLNYKLRNALVNAVVSARKNQLGVWAHDRTSNLPLTNVEAITEQYPIMPKLFRRLMRLYGRQGSFDNFPKYLAERREAVLDRIRVQFTYTYEIVRQSGNSVALPFNPEDLVFIG